MADKTDFWGVSLLPWKPQNRAKYAFYIFVFALFLITFIHIVVRVCSGQVCSVSLWWLLLIVGLPVAFWICYSLIGKLVENAARKLPQDTIIRSDCIVVTDFREMPAVAQVSGDQLIILPIFGKQITIPMGEILKVEESHWCNGSLTLGRTIFFKLKLQKPVSGLHRLGFAVDYKDPWEKLFSDKLSPA